MNVIEAPMKLGRDLLEINTTVVRRMTEITGEGIKQYLETNQEFAKKLPEVRDLSSFMELQRDYGQTLYTGATERFQTRGEVIREAFEKSGAAIRSVFDQDEAVEEVAEEAAA